jgi:hypothetical protein
MITQRSYKRFLITVLERGDVLIERAELGGDRMMLIASVQVGKDHVKQAAYGPYKRTDLEPSEEREVVQVLKETLS